MSINPNSPDTEEQEEKILIPGEQPDGSIVDMYGNVMTRDARYKILEVIGGLPVTEQKNSILSTIHDHPITIIDGSTGSGKTTQIPKWIAEQTGFKKRVVVTQPRVLAARSNATRVSEELLADHGNPYHSIGHNIGYRTGRGVSSPHTSPLSFHTDALELMRQMVANVVPDILFLDEVHNYSIPTEFLAMLMKRAKLKTKLIIMSATLDSGIFQEYYKSIDSTIPVIQIPGRTYPVKRYFEDGANGFASVKKCYTEGKNILIFAPGKKEITGIITKLQKEIGAHINIFPLHADMSKEEQQFLLTNTTGKPRIIVSTNVAEESITIDYLDVIFDFGTHKIARYNHLGIPELRLQNISRANANQRAGRAGRTHEGEAFYSNETPFDELRLFPEAPIEREMLDRYMLLGFRQGIDIMKLREQSEKKGEQLFFHEFDKTLFQISLRRLRQIGAITRDNQITPLGRDLLEFPLDVYHARMLRESFDRGCSEDIIYATAILDKKGFLSKNDAWKKIKLSKTTEGDLFTYIELFKFVTSTTLTKKQKENLVALGISAEELEVFEKINKKRAKEGLDLYKLYEMVDLTPVDIKNKNVKDIDELVQKLITRLEDMEMPIESSNDINEKKICLAAGSLHTIFEWDPKKKKFRNRDHKLDEHMLYFTLGDVSVVKPHAHHLYIGVPFIIGGGEGEEDFPLVTFVTPIDEGHIKSIHHDFDTLFDNIIVARSTHEKPRTTGVSIKFPPLDNAIVTTGNLHHLGGQGSQETQDTKAKETIMTPPQASITKSQKKKQQELKEPRKPALTIDDAVAHYAEALEAYQRGTESNQFQTDEGTREYYLKHCLPDLLIGYNQGIKNYLQGRTPEEIFVFRELLTRFLLREEISRIHPASTKQTEKSFMYDSIILQAFRESTDPYIVAFRDRKPLPAQKVPTAKTHSYEAEEEPKESHEVAELRKLYAKTVGYARTKIKKPDIQKIQDEIITKYVAYLEQSSGSYATLIDSHKRIGESEKSVVSGWIKDLKGLGKRELELKKLRHKRGLLLNVIENLESLIVGNYADYELLSSYNFGPEFGEKRKDEIYKALERIRDPDRRKRKNATIVLQKLRVDLQAETQKIDIDVAEIIREKNMEHIPLAKSTHEALEKIFQRLFHPSYYHHVVAHQIFEITRAIVRDNQTEHHGIDAILFNFLREKDFKQVRLEFGEIFSMFQTIIGSIDEIEVYMNEMYESVKESSDAEYIKKQITNLNNNIASLEKLREFMNDLRIKLSFKEGKRASDGAYTPPKPSSLKPKPRVRRKQDSILEEIALQKKMQKRTEDEARHSGLLNQIRQKEEEQKGFLSYHLEIQSGIRKDIRRAQYVLEKKQGGKENEISQGKYKELNERSLQEILSSREKDLAETTEYIEKHGSQLRKDEGEYEKICQDLKTLRKQFSRR